jgi:hypothetical protein
MIEPFGPEIEVKFRERIVGYDAKKTAALHFEKLSSIEALKNLDLSSIKIAVVDNFGFNRPLYSGYHDNHGPMVCEVLETALDPNQIIRIEKNPADKVKQPDSAHIKRIQYLSIALEEINQLSNQDMPTVINHSASFPLPTDEELADDARSLNWQKTPQEIEQEIILLKQLYLSELKKLFDLIFNLRSRGAIFVASYGNDPGTPADKFSLLESQAITVDGIGPDNTSIFDSSLDMAYLRFGRGPHAADVTGVACWLTKDREFRPIKKGNSFAAPMVSLAVALVIQSNPQLLCLNEIATIHKSEESESEKEKQIRELLMSRDARIVQLLNQAVRYTPINSRSPQSIAYLNFEELIKTLSVANSD